MTVAPPAMAAAPTPATPRDREPAPVARAPRAGASPAVVSTSDAEERPQARDRAAASTSGWLRPHVEEQVGVGRDVTGDGAPPGVRRLQGPHGGQALPGHDRIPHRLALDADDLELPPAAMHHVDDVAVRGQWC